MAAVNGVTVYVNGDPVNLVDPNGHKACSADGPEGQCAYERPGVVTQTSAIVTQPLTTYYEQHPFSLTPEFRGPNAGTDSLAVDPALEMPLSNLTLLPAFAAPIGPICHFVGEWLCEKGESVSQAAESFAEKFLAEHPLLGVPVAGVVSAGGDAAKALLKGAGEGGIVVGVVWSGVTAGTDEYNRTHDALSAVERGVVIADSEASFAAIGARLCGFVCAAAGAWIGERAPDYAARTFESQPWLGGTIMPPRGWRFP